MNRIIKDLHIAAQFLAAAAISFKHPNKDDSHTNLGWNQDLPGLNSRDLDDSGISMSLRFSDFTLVMNRNEKELWSMPLSGKKNGDVVVQLKQVFKDLSFNKTYSIKLHYDIGYSDLGSHQFGIYSNEELKKEVDLRTSALSFLSNCTIENKSEIRVWPHHFDMAFLIQVSKNNSIGVGMAIPDSVVDDYYYYVAGWKGDEAVDPINFNPLRVGEWISKSWKGGVLKANSKNVSIFLEETISKIRSIY